MKSLKLINGTFVIDLENYGYLIFEPLARTNDKQAYSATLKINNAMVISGGTISTSEDIRRMFVYEIINTINCMKETLNNIQKELYEKCTPETSGTNMEETKRN